MILLYKKTRIKNMYIKFKKKKKKKYGSMVQKSDILIS